jgi:hypothetical protein
MGRIGKLGFVAELLRVRAPEACGGVAPRLGGRCWVCMAICSDPLRTFAPDFCTGKTELDQEVNSGAKFLNFVPGHVTNISAVSGSFHINIDLRYGLERAGCPWQLSIGRMR